MYACIVSLSLSLICGAFLCLFSAHLSNLTEQLSVLQADEKLLAPKSGFFGGSIPEQPLQRRLSSALLQATMLKLSVLWNDFVSISAGTCM